MTAGPSEGERETGRVRRRPGRVRRWLVRPVVWLPVVLLVLSVAAYYAARSDWAKERARRLVVAEVSRVVGRPVEVAALDYTLVPPRVTARGVVVLGPAPDSPPFARIAGVAVDLDLAGTWSRPKIGVEQVAVVEPEVTLLLAADGTSNLPDFDFGEEDGEGSRAEVRIGTVLVERGVFRYDDLVLPLDFTARGVWGRLVGPPGPVNHVRGEPAPAEPPRFAVAATAGELTVTLPRAVPYRGSVSLSGTVEAGRVELATARIAGPDLTARLAGHYAWQGEERRLRLEVDAEGSLALANRLGYLEEPISGRFGLVGEVDAPSVRAPGGTGVVPASRPPGGGVPWAFRAAVRSPRIDFGGRSFTAVAADVAGDRAGVTVDVGRAAYAGGGLTGRLEVETAGAGLGEPVPMELAAALRGASLQPVLQDLALDLPGVGGLVDGTLSYRFTSADPTRGDGRGTLALTGVERRPGAVPVAGRAPFTIERGVATSPAIRLEAPAQLVVGSGALDLGSGRGNLLFTLTSADLGRLSPLLPVADDPDFTPWLPTAGSGTVEGSVDFDAAGAAGSLRFDLAAPATPTLAVDRLAGGLDFRPGLVHGLHLAAAAGGGTVTVAGEVPIPTDGRADADGLDLTFDAERWPAARLAFLLPDPSAVELDGAVSGRVVLGGGFAALTGRAELTAEPLVVAGTALDRAAADVAFGPERVEVERARAELPAGEVTLSGVWDPRTDTLDFDLAAPDLDLAAEPLASLLPGGAPSEAGRLAVTAKLAGTSEHPEASLTLRARRATDGPAEGESGEGGAAGGRGATELTATWRDDRLEADGSLLGLVTFHGGGRLDRKAADLSFAVASEHLPTLVEVATGYREPGLEGSFEGTLGVAGDPREPTRLTARLELARLTASYGDHRVANLEPVVARMAGGELTIESVYLGEAAASELFVSGTVGLGGEFPLALNVQSSLSAAWAELVVPGIDAEGSFEVLANVRGTAADPEVSGQGEVQDGRVILAGFPHSFTGLTATVLLYPSQAVLDSLTAACAGGTFRAAGRVDLTRLAEGKFDYRFQFSGEGMSVRFPEGFLLRGGANATLLSAGEGRQIVGTADLRRAFYLEDVPVKVGQLLQRLLQRQRIEAGETDEDLASTQLNLTVRGPGALRVRNNLADLRGDVDLTIRGTLANPVVFGTVEAERGGTIVYADNEYRVERGLLTFANPHRIDPVIDLVATTDVHDYDVTLQLSGTLDRLDASFTSDPPLPNLDVLALLTTGQTLEQGGRIAAGTDAGTQGATQGGAQTFLYGQAASVVTERVNQLFGFDQFRVNPIAGSGTGGTSVAFTVGKQFSRDFYVTYSRDPTSSLDYVIQAEWSVGYGITLVLTQNGNQSYAVDVRWEKRF